MDIQAAIQIIEESPKYEQFSALKKIFKDRLDELKESDFTERGICYYYLLRIVLRSHLMYETEECREYLEGMNREFLRQLKKYKKDGDRFEQAEIADFFRLMERSYSSLEVIFLKKDFLELREKTYQAKMEYRRYAYAFQKQWWLWFEYWFLKTTTAYGSNFLRWGATAFIFAITMAGLYRWIDWATKDPALTIVPAGGHWYDYIYFSVITITSLGYGDLVAKTFLAKVVVSVEVFLGFIMLGIFINLIQKKM